MVSDRHLQIPSSKFSAKEFSSKNSIAKNSICVSCLPLSSVYYPSSVIISPTPLSSPKNSWSRSKVHLPRASPHSQRVGGLHNSPCALTLVAQVNSPISVSSSEPPFPFWCAPSGFGLLFNDTALSWSLKNILPELVGPFWRGRRVVLCHSWAHGLPPLPRFSRTRLLSSQQGTEAEMTGGHCSPLQLQTTEEIDLDSNCNNQWT